MNKWVSESECDWNSFSFPSCFLIRVREGGSEGGGKKKTSGEERVRVRERVSGWVKERVDEGVNVIIILPVSLTRRKIR